MLRTTLKAISLAGFLTGFAAVPALADLPAGYERWVAPDSDFNVETNVEVRSESVVPLKEKWLSTGFRPVDLEIIWYDPEPDVRELYDGGNPLWHRVSVVEVPDDGSVVASDWWDLSFAWYAGDLLEVDRSRQRISDFELYYREDPWIQPSIDAGKWIDPGNIAMCAVIVEENKGENHSDWEFIPPTAYLEFWNRLSYEYDVGRRPYDIEFAIHPDGYLVGAALLAPNRFLAPNDDFVPVNTTWTFFHPSHLPVLYGNGWQLLDVEARPPGWKQDPMARDLFYDEDMRFGIFVKVPWMFSPTDTYLDLFVSEFDVGIYPNVLLPHPARVIDIEMDGHWIPNYQPGKPNEVGVDLYTEAWLKGG